jgi:hypothetical protein
MSKENVENYRRNIAAWNSGDPDARLAATKPHGEFAVWDLPRAAAHTCRGVEGARQPWNHCAVRGRPPHQR